MPYDITQYNPAYGGTINSSGNVVNVADAINASGQQITTTANTSTSVSIATSGTTSGAITLAGQTLCGLIMPSTWDGGNITIMGCDTSGGTYVDVYDSYGSIVTLTVAGGSRLVGLSGSHLQAVANAPYIKLKAASAVAASRTIVVLTKG